MREGLVKRRHVIYVHGYDPQGPTGYYRLFKKECRKFRTTWSVNSDLSDLQIESNDFAQLECPTTSAPNWTVATRYDFLRYEDVLNSNLSEPLYRQVPRALHWLIEDLFSGATYRIIRAAWRFWLHLFGFQLGLLIWLALALIAGWVGDRATLAIFPGLNLARPSGWGGRGDCVLSRTAPRRRTSVYCSREQLLAVSARIRARCRAVLRSADRSGCAPAHGGGCRQ